MKHILTIVTIWLLSAFSISIIAEEKGKTIKIKLSEPGTLLDKIKENKWATASVIRFKGPINTDDLKEIKNRCLKYDKIESIDLKEAILSDSKNFDFEDCKYLKNITLPQSIQILTDKFFKGCTSLNNITIPQSVKEIGAEAFDSCISIKNIELPLSIKELKDNTFKNCKQLNSIVLTDSILTIGKSCFENCESLQNLNLPNSINEINEGAFKNCKSLIALSLPTNLKYISRQICMNCDNLNKITISNEIKYIEQYAFYNCKNLTSAEIPNSVESIESYAFAGTGINHANISGQIEFIDNYSFAYCYNLQDINIKDGVKEIGEGAFEDDYNLITINIPQSVEIINSKAFKHCCNLQNINIANGNSNYSSIDGVLLSADNKKIILYPSGKKDEEYSTPESIEEIGDNAFCQAHNLKNLIIGTNVNTIQLAFDNSKFTNQTNNYVSAIEKFTVAPNNKHFRSIGGVLYDKDGKILIQYPHANKNTNYTIPNDVIYIEPWAFANNFSLTSINLPNNLREIREHAFDGCHNIHFLTIPSSVNEIKEKAFANCYGLSVIMVLAQNPPTCSGSNIFTNDNTDDYSYTRVLRVPSRSIDAYKQIEQWKQFGEIECLDEVK